MMELVQDLFILFWCSFVPDVSFGNGWFASSDWPANKRERDVIFDPFLGVRNMICFAPGKLCFPLREIDFVTENSLPARGWNSSGVVVFYRGHRGPTRNLAGERFSRPLHQKTGKIRPFWRGKVAVYRPNQTSRQPVFDRFSAVEDAKSRSFRTGFSPGFRGNSGSNDGLLRETTHRFTPQLQPAEDVERAGAAVRAEGVDALFSHRSDGVVAGLGRLPTRSASVANGKDQDALLGQSIFDSKRIAVVKLFAPGFSSRTEDSSHSILHGFLDRLTTSAFAPLRMK